MSVKEGYRVSREAAMEQVMRLERMSFVRCWLPYSVRVRLSEGFVIVCEATGCPVVVTRFSGDTKADYWSIRKICQEMNLQIIWKEMEDEGKKLLN